mmetsp:Transcript_33378/g.88383  ORF Transcript_33378/g.88383 Transcript_33378/m.88383 type:complete len:204 (-) Transcript_33378:250-861(-)
MSLLGSVGAGGAVWRDGSVAKPAPRCAARGRENGGNDDGSPSPCSSPRRDEPSSPIGFMGPSVLGDITNMAVAILSDLGKATSAGKSPANGAGLRTLPLPPQHSPSRGAAAAATDRSALLESAAGAVRESLAAQGALDSAWTNALAIRLGCLPADPQLQEILNAHRWTGTQFATPPDRGVLLADLARAKAQASGRRRPRFGGA